MSYPIANDVVAIPELTTANANYATDLSGLPATYQNDDYVCIFVIASSGSAMGTLSNSVGGWTEVTSYAPSSLLKMGFWYVKVAAGTFTTPTFNVSSGSAIWQGFAWIERDMDTTNPIAGFATANATATSLTTGTLTPNVSSVNKDNARVMYCVANRGSAYSRFLPGSGIIGEALGYIDNGSQTQTAIVGSVMQTSAAATAATTYNTASTLTASITVCLNNKTSGQRAKHASPGVSRLAWLGDFGNTHDGTLTPTLSTVGVVDNGGTTWDGAGAINGITVSATDPARITTGIGSSAWGLWDQITYAVNAAAWQGKKYAFSADVDFTGKLFSMEFLTVGPLGIVTGVEGLIVAFADSTGANWKAFQVAKKNGWVVANTYVPTIDVANGTTYASGGTLNVANIRSVSILMHRAGLGTTGRSVLLRNMSLVSATTIVGGNSATPLTINYLRKALHGWAYQGLVGGEYPAATLRSDTQIGDGSTATYYDATGTLHAFPDAFNVLTQREINVPANQLDLTVYAGSSDTINMTATAVSASSTTQQNLTVSPSSSTSATYDFSGCVDSGTLTSLQPGIIYTGLTVTGSRLQLAAAGTYTFTTVIATRIDFTPTAASTYVLGSGTFSGQLDLRNTSATYAITVELPSGTSYTTGNNTGAAITVTLPTITADISITSIPTAVGADRRLQIINTTAAAASAWASATSYSTGDVVLRTTGVGSESTAGLYMRCTTAGTSGGTEPAWDTTVGNTTADNTVTWTTYAVLFYDADPAASSYTTTYVDGEEFLAGEEVAIRCAEMDGSTSFKTYSTAVIAATTGFSALVSEESDTVFATYALDGSAYDTTFSPNYAANYIVLDTNTDFSGASAYAYYCWLLTTTDGMYRFWGGLTALDTGNIRNNNSVISLYFDESAGFVKQTDNVRIFRNDGARPAIDPTTGGNGIEINWRVPVNVVSTGGSALTTEEHDHLMSRPSASATASAVANVAVDGDVTLAESMRLQNSILGGKVSGAGTGTEVFRSLADDKDRVTATVDSSGNRSVVVRDLT